MIIESIGAAVVVMAVSLTGVIFAYRATARWVEYRLPFLVSFSAGVFLVTAGGLALEVFEIAESVWQGAVFILAGYILAFLIHRLLPEAHHHHDAECSSQHGAAARKLIIGDAIHNIADGVVIVVAFTASLSLGIAALISIVIHEALQEVSEFFVLRRAGYSVKRALGINLAVSSTILIGVGLGYFALASHELEVMLLALSAGFFLHVVFHDLLPKPQEQERMEDFFVHGLVVLLGALLMGFVVEATTDGHSHGDNEQGHEEAHVEHHDEEEHHE